MRRLLSAPLLALLLAVVLFPAAAEDGFVFEDEIPPACIRQLQGAGTVRRYDYTAHDYLGDGAEITKRVWVYLPEGYAEDGCYDVLVLCHGIGGTETEWGFAKDFSTQKNIADQLIRRGEARPLIIVMPNGRSCAAFNDTRMENAQAFYLFGQELRSDLLPWVDAHFATWAARHPDDPDGAREHRAMAGLSMGGMQTINIGLCECLDLFSAFGAFSAAPTTYTAAEIAARLKAFPDLPVRYFYSLCGTDDSLYFAGSAAAKDLPAFTDRFTKANWHWQERPGGHDFSIWNLGLYNFLRLLGSLK